MKALLKRIRQILRDRRVRKFFTRFVSTIAAIVVFVTTYALILPAITLEKVAVCGIEEHQHDTSCYEDVLTCGLEESDGHKHDDSCYKVVRDLLCEISEHEHGEECYDENGELICTIAEHIHGEKCYKEYRELTCGITESEGHHHDASCYKKVLTCGKEIHVHSTACYHSDAESETAGEDAATAGTKSSASAGAGTASTARGTANADASDGTADASSVGSAAASTGAVDGKTGRDAGENHGSTESVNAGRKVAAYGSTGSDASAAATTNVMPEEVKEKLSDGYVPQLDPVDMEAVLGKNTGFYYYDASAAAENGQDIPADSSQITDWKKYKDDDVLEAADILRLYLPYTIPAGTLNSTNQIARYRLPGNIRLDDAQIVAINETENGLAGSFVNYDTLEITDSDKYEYYRGAEAEEGTRKPDQDVNDYLYDLVKHGGSGEEYISAVVKAENVFDEKTGDYLGQDLIFIFTPYSIEKNQNEYDTTGKPVKAGEKITGWFACDIHTSQVDWTISESKENGKNGTQYANVVFVNEDKTAGTKKISETLTLADGTSDEFMDSDISANGYSTEDKGADQPDSPDTADTSEAAKTTKENADRSEAENEAASDSVTVMDDEPAATNTADGDAAEDNGISMPAVTFDDSIRVRGAELASDALALDSMTGSTTIKVHVEADEDTFPAGTRMVLYAVPGQNLDSLAQTVQGAVESAAKDSAGRGITKTRGFHAVDISFLDADGRKIEPAKPVRVSLSSDRIKEAVEDASMAPLVVHVEEVKTPDASGESDTSSVPDAIDETGFSGSEERTDSAGQAETVSTEIKGTGDPGSRNDTLTFEAGAFSVYAVVYTVDFRWEVDGKKYEYSFAGGDSISFRKLAEILHIVEEDSDLDAFIAGIESLRFSSPELVWVGKLPQDMNAGQIAEAEGLDVEYSAELSEKLVTYLKAKKYAADEWVLIGVKPFDTEEKLYVTMADGETFTIEVTDAQIATGALQDGEGYIIYTTDEEGRCYVLKTDGTTVRFDNTAGFDILTSEYKWTFTYVYVENGIERYNIHADNNPLVTFSLNRPGDDLLGTGPNNVTIVPDENGGYTFGGFNNTKLVLIDDTANNSKKFVAQAQDTGAQIYIYEQAPLDTYTFDISTNDTKMGTVSGRNNAGGNENTVVQFTSVTSLDKTNQYMVRAIPRSEKYIFDHWELNGSTVYTNGANNTQVPLGSTISPGALTIPSYGSRLEAVFKLNPNYEPPDDEKEGQGFDAASKEALNQWLQNLLDRQVPLNSKGCDKTAEVVDYENRIYRVDLTAQSSLVTFDGDIDLGFILDVSGSMQFPSKLTDKKADGTTLPYLVVNNINNGNSGLDTNQYYYLIADKAGTATVYRLFYGTYYENTWYGSIPHTGWWAVDSSYSDDDSRHFLIDSNSKFSNDSAGMSYQIYRDGDLQKDNGGNIIYDTNGRPVGYKRLDYLRSSIENTVTELNSILNILALAKNDGSDPDVKIAYNTFYSSVNHSQYDFNSVKNGLTLNLATNGGTSTDLALADARNFHWGEAKSTKKYAILITDGAPQRSGRAIASSEVAAQAQALQKGHDGVAGTDDDITLITIGLSMGDVKRGSALLYDLADRDSDNEKMFFKAESGDELEYALMEILQRIMVDATVQGNVSDTISEAFYPVDTEGNPLVSGDKIDEKGNRLPREYEGSCGTVQNDGCTIVWTNQEFTTDGWHGIVYVKAKEDLLGGNAVRTNNGNTYIEAKKYKTPSMESFLELKDNSGSNPQYVTRVDGLESPMVNVNELQFTHNQTEWTVYLGTEVDPSKQLEALYKKILVEEAVSAAEDQEGNDDLPDHITSASDMLYPRKTSISDQRESEIAGGSTPAFFTMNDLLKKLVAGKNYAWWDYGKGEPRYPEFFTAVSTGNGIVLDYDVYGLNDPEHHLENPSDPEHPIVKHDGGSIQIKLTKEILDAALTDPLNGPHATAVTGTHAEKYTLTVLYSPDYEILPEGQNGSSVDNFHVGTFETVYNGHAAGTETSENIHKINVYTKPIQVKKVDPEDSTLAGAEFAIYRDARDKNSQDYGSAGRDQIIDPANAASFVEISRGTTSDPGGLVTLANTGTTADTRLIPGEIYYLIETAAPTDYQLNETVKTITVQTQTDGAYTDLNKMPITETVSDGQGGETTQVLTDLSRYTDPFNWTQGVRLLVDGSTYVVYQDITGSGTSAHTTTVERPLKDGEYVHQDNIQFQTTVVDESSLTKLEVTKRWEDEKGNNKAKANETPAYSVTFKVVRTTQTNTTPEDVNLEGRVESGPGITVNDDNTAVTLTYQEDGWPTVRIINLPRMVEGSGEEYTYQVRETVCNPPGKVNIDRAVYKVTEPEQNNGIRKITIVNLEKETTQIKVDKEWYDANNTKLDDAPEGMTSITFELYRKATISCKHVWVLDEDNEATVPATCTVNGKRIYKCDKCSDTKEETIPALGHDWGEWTVTVPATVSSDGEEERVCARCKETETRPISKLPHEHLYEDLQYTVEPTCTEDGTAYRKCTICGETTGDPITIPALGHKWVEESTEQPTCTKSGHRHLKCERCEETNIIEIAPLGHDWEYVDTIAPNAQTYEDNPNICVPTMIRSYTCRNNCGEQREDETIPAIMHAEEDWGEWQSLVEATETTPGTNIRYCKRNPAHFQTQTVPATGEAYGNTGLPVSKYEWPDVSYMTQEELNNTYTTIQPAGIIKSTINGEEIFLVFFAECTCQNSRIKTGPKDDWFDHYRVILTGTILTVDNIEKNNAGGKISPTNQGDLFKTEDGEYYVYISTNTECTNMWDQNNNTVKLDPQYWLHIQKPTPEAAIDKNDMHLSGCGGNGKMARTSFGKAALLHAFKGDVIIPTVSETDETEPVVDENVERRARLARLMGTTEDQIFFRSEAESLSSVDVWEYVDSYTGSGTGWHWDLNNLDAFDDEGNEYTYYVVETAPSETAFEITYANNGVKDSDANDTITIKNRQKTGSVKVTKEFSGIASLPVGFKITAAYTVEEIDHLVELTTASAGVTGDGTSINPYTWTIDSLPIGTVVTFTELGYNADGYNVTVTGSSTASEKTTASATAAAAPGTASFVNTYTRKITLDILKIEKGKPAVTIPGAGFTLREVNEQITSNAPSYKIPNDPGVEKTTVDGGTTAFESLALGYYEIRETGIPEGYIVTGDDACYIRITDAGAQMVKVNASCTGWEDTNSIGNFEFAPASGNIHAKLTISNEPGVELPSAGGPGTRLIYILGSMLTGLGLLLLLGRKRGRI